MALYIGTPAGSGRLCHAEWVALSNGRSGSREPEYSLLGEDPDNLYSASDRKIEKLSPTQQSLVLDAFMNLYDELQKEHQKKQE